MKGVYMKRFLISLAVVVILGGTFAMASAATISTDKPDYAPGEVVIITGSGWMPGETVSMILHEESEFSEPDVTLLSDADTDGNIINAVWAPDINDIGLTFTLTATGQTSGLTAETTFTDDVQINSSCPNGSHADESCVITGVTGVCVWGCRKDANDQCHSNQAVSLVSGTPCTDDGNVCTVDVCNGSTSAPECTHAAGNAGTECRASAGVCDVAEVCDGLSNDCPGDGFQPSSYECRGSAGTCDVAENCTGSSADCPADVKSTAECRGIAGVCDVAEVCDGLSNDCPGDGFQPSSYECRGSAGACDIAENCTGTSAICPDDAKSTDVCRATAGDCDVAESCDGSNNDCPEDVFKSAGYECRPSVGICDATETCTGNDPQCPVDALAQCSLVTSSSLCTFSIDAVYEDQFRLILTPDQSASVFKLNASNPGQFYYNILYLGSGDTCLTITLPYPFVTQGAMPVHVYENVTMEYYDRQTCFVPGNEIANSPTQVTLDDYDSGSTTAVEVCIPYVPGGLAYINMHLDYGLKGTTGYSKNYQDDAVEAGDSSNILIPQLQPYYFGDSTGNGDEVYSENVFKRIAGIGGLVLADNGDPAPNIAVEIYDPHGMPITTVLTDQDGWYVLQYKHTGKASLYTVTLPDLLPAYDLTQTVTLKSNGYVNVDFDLPPLD